MQLHRNRWLVLAVVAACFIPVTVDATVLYLAIPALTRALGASATEVLWIVDIYPLVMAGLVLVAGPLGDRIGQKALLLAGLLAFGIASVMAAFAPSPMMLIAARIVLALGGAMIIPSTLAIVRRVFTDRRERGIAIGIWGAVASGGAAIGPILGGILLEEFWWGSVFLINVPLLLLTGGIALALLANERNPAAAPLQPLAALPGMLGLIGLVYAIKAVAHGSSAGIALATGLGGLAAVIWFVRGQLRQARPMLDLRLFTLPRFSIGVAAALGPIAILVGFELVIAQQLQFVGRLSPLEAGLTILPLPLAAFLTGPLAGYSLARHGMYRVATAALTVAALGYFALWIMGQGSPGGIGTALAFIGAGHGAIMAVATETIMTAAPPEKAGAAAAIESVAYEVGGGLGVALFGSLAGVLYSRGFTGTAGGSPDPAESIGAAMIAAGNVGGDQGAAIIHAAAGAYQGAYAASILVAGIGCLLLGIVIGQVMRGVHGRT